MFALHELSTFFSTRLGHIYCKKKRFRYLAIGLNYLPMVEFQKKNENSST